MSDTSKTEADFANILNEAFGRGSIHAELENSDYLSHHLKADEKMAAYREWRDAKARELAAVTAERDALRRDAQTLVSGLHAELAERDAEIASLREANSTFASAAIRKDEQPRTDAEWKAADRKKRINDLAARYAGEIAGNRWSTMTAVHRINCLSHADDMNDETTEWVQVARALAAAVVEAEE